MIEPSYSNRSILALFGRGDVASLAAAVAKMQAARAAVPAVARVAAPPAASAPAPSVDGSAQADDGTRTWSRWDLEPHTAALLKLAAQREAVEAAFDASFEVKGGPLVGERDGSKVINNVEVRYEGRLVLTVTDSTKSQDQKTVTTYDAKGEVAQQEEIYAGWPIGPA